MSLVATLRTLAKKLNNYDIDATAGGLWTSTTTYRVTVPTGKRWFLLGGWISRDANATISTYIYDSSDNIIGMVAYAAAAATAISYPTSTMQIGEPWTLDEGEYLQTTFGAAQGAAAYHTSVMLEVDV